jgi:hypothetical protein
LILNNLATAIRSDLYSLWITLWEMLSGKLSFQGSAVNLIYQHRPDLSEVHLPAARHLCLSYRDFERARVQIAIAASLPNILISFISRL